MLKPHLHPLITPLVIALGLLLLSCGSPSAGKSTPKATQPTTSVPTLTPSALISPGKTALPTLAPGATPAHPTPTIKPPTTTRSYLAAWCQLKIGQTTAVVVAFMGPPHGSKAKNYQVTGQKTYEWDVGIDILLASFSKDKAVSLKAYAGQVGPEAATNLGCQAFRP